MPSSVEVNTADPRRSLMGFPLFFELVMLAFTLSVASYSVRSVISHGTVATQPVTGVWTIVTVFAAVTVGMLLLLRSTRGTKIAGAVFALTLFLGTGVALASSFGAAISVLGTTVAIFVYYTDPPVWAYDIIVTTGIAGIAASLGWSFTPEFVLAATVLLALYDVIAVYGTKHMVAMARILLRRRVFFAMIVPDARASLRARLTAVGTGERFTFLGTGDLMMPALLVASIVARYGVPPAVFVSIGIMLGYVILNLLFIRGRGRTMAALPPIAAGALIGYGISFFLHQL